MPALQKWTQYYRALTYMGIPLNGTTKQKISDGLKQGTKRNNRTNLIGNHNNNNNNNINNNNQFS